MRINGLSLCAGIGGLELGLRLAVPGYRCVGYCERDAYAAAVIVARMEGATLDRAPIWDDLATFPSDLYSGKVDLISAGFPCQPFSVAGRHKGTKDSRWIWPDIARIIREVRPRIVFLENVPALLSFSGGYGAVLGDLAEGGFDAEWDVFSAAGVGAPHLRKRLFILACRHDERSDGSGLHLRPGRQEQAEGCFSGGGKDVSNVSGAPFPPGPSDTAGWADALQRDPTLEPAVRGVADGVAYRVDRLRCCGNAVVPVVAAVAFTTLQGRHTTRPPTKTSTETSE